MKNFVSVAVVFLLCCAAYAAPILYDGITVDVDYTVGTGSSRTMVVVDWESGLSQSHAWLYQYDGAKAAADALDAIAAEVSSFEWSQSAFVQYINYNDGDDNHQTVNTGWISFWNKDSGDWQLNGLGVYEQQLVNGGWSGANADDYPNWGSAAPTIPQVPEPAAIAVICLGMLLARRKK